jgi:hypothetical protein
MSASPSHKIATCRLLAAIFACASIVAATSLVVVAQNAMAASSGRPQVASRSTQPVALAARRLYLVENATLHLTGEGETNVIERGQASGTFDAPLTANLKLSVGHVAGLFKIFPKGGSISGQAQARYVVQGSIGYYGGTLTITHGTGRYSKASGSNIDISGTINHLNYELTVKAHGWASL